ncbi:MAG: Uma2 family endonuclease [Oscillatoriales cyanobacterium SM2_2_1]|nr:Uma2 family endonuclease [Oscillatoriales cyanobacterium SM2_2_1]
MTVAFEKDRNLLYRQWHPATWQDYEKLRDAPSPDRVQLFFFDNQLLAENMGGKSLLHSEARELLSLILGLWLMRHPEINSKILGGCLMEKVGKQAVAPDIALYLGDNLPRYREGESRRINLDRDRVPDLVVEVADTTLDSDLDEKKHLYAELNVPEYWVIDAKGAQAFIFLFQAGRYLRSESSRLLPGFTDALLSRAIEQMKAGANISAVLWFNEQLSLSLEES